MKLVLDAIAKPPSTETLSGSTASKPLTLATAPTTGAGYAWTGSLTTTSKGPTLHAAQDWPSSTPLPP